MTTEAGNQPIETGAEDTSREGYKVIPWWNGSRLRLMTIYLPLLLAEIAAVAVLAYNVFRVPTANVSIHNTALTYCGLLTAQYFIFIACKDLAIFLSQLFYGGFTGFWSALILHLLSLTLDVIVLLGLAIWGSVVLN